MALLTGTIGACWVDLYHFLLVQVLIVMLYAYLGVSLLGAKIKVWSTMRPAVYELMKMFLGDVDSLPDISIAEPFTGLIFFWSFMILSNLLMLNIAVAITVQGFIT